MINFVRERDQVGCQHSLPDDRRDGTDADRSLLPCFLVIGAAALATDLGMIRQLVNKHV